VGERAFEEVADVCGERLVEFLKDQSAVVMFVVLVTLEFV